MVTTVIPYGQVREPERLANEALRSLIGRVPGASPEFEVLHGHPSTALSQYASERGYELIAVGSRGGGLTHAVLGSAATELARDSKVPVLVVGG